MGWIPSKNNKPSPLRCGHTFRASARHGAIQIHTNINYWWAPASELQVMHHVFIDVAKNKRWLQVKLESGHPSTCFSFSSNRIVFCINPRGGDVKSPLTLIFKIHKHYNKIKLQTRGSPLEQIGWREKWIPEELLILK